MAGRNGGFKDRFRVLRILNGLTQTDLAARSGIPQQQIACWETGKFKPDLANGVALASALGVEAKCLTGESKISAAVWRLKSPRQTQHIRALSEDINKLLPEFLLSNNLAGAAVVDVSDGTVFAFAGQVTDILEYRALLFVKGCPPLAEAVMTALAEQKNKLFYILKASKDLTFSEEQNSCDAFNGEAMSSWVESITAHLTPTSVKVDAVANMELMSLLGRLNPVRPQEGSLSQGARMKQVRSQIGLTQAQFGEKIGGFNLHKIKDIEAGKQNVTPEIALRLEELCGVDFRWLLTGLGSDNTNSLVFNSIIRLLHSFDDETLKWVLTMIEEKKELVELRRIMANK